MRTNLSIFPAGFIYRGDAASLDTIIRVGFLMGAFNYDSFADLTRVFDARKGQVVPPIPKARVILFASTALRPQSKFVNVRAYMPMAKPVFVLVAAKKISPPPAPVVVPEPAAVIEAPAAPAPKLSGTLRLKTKVDLPPAVARRGSYDIAAAFKAEVAIVEKKEPETAADLEDIFNKRRLHPLSRKSWSELIAEAEAREVATRPKKDFDLGAAFKAEMKAFEAEQEKLAAEEALAAKPAVSRPRAALKLAA